MLSFPKLTQSHGGLSFEGEREGEKWDKNRKQNKGRNILSSNPSITLKKYYISNSYLINFLKNTKK